MSTVISLPTNDATGVFAWLGLLFIIGVISVIIFEFTRQSLKFKHIFYTRLLSGYSTNLAIPKKYFEWIWTVYHTRESTLLEEAGVDAVMYLRYLLMSFYLFTTIGIVLCVILIPVNYYASEQGTYNATVSNRIYEVAANSLTSVSITKVQDGSSLLWVHAVCAYFVSAFTFLTLFASYSTYTETTSKTLLKRLSDHKDIKQRTILINNLSSSLSTRQALENWFSKMELPISKIHMNSVDDQELIQLVKKYEHYLFKLERAYMAWAMNIYKFMTKRRWTFLTPRQKMYIATVPMPNDVRAQSEQHSKDSRPILVRADTQRIVIARLDVIKLLFRKVKELEEAIHTRRVHITTMIKHPTDSHILSQLLQFTPQLQGVYDSVRAPSVSAFVTFTEPRFAYQALQMLLHSSVDGFTMSVSPAPAPHEVLWDSLSKSFLDRKIKTAFISFLAFFISVLWVYPTFYISSLATFTTPESSDNVLLLFFEQFLPPILVFLCAKGAPYLLEYFSYRQCFDSKIQADSATLSKYFYFLMLNVHFVFTLLSSAWGTSDAIFSNPLQWVESVSVSFPSGATFFINYVILNVIAFPVELLRPVPIAYFYLMRIFSSSPRDYQQLNEDNSILNYGFIFPMHILVFIVVLCYSVISPLVIFPGIMYFGSAWLVYKNQLLYVYVKSSESHGAYWYMAWKRSVVGLGLFQFLTAGLLSAKKAPYPAVFVGMLVPITYIFFLYCEGCFARHDVVVPLEHLYERQGGDGIDQDSLQRVSVRSPLTFDDGKKKDHDRYTSPAISQPLAQLWVPKYIEHLVKLEEDEIPGESLIVQVDQQNSSDVDLVKNSGIN